jgi:putative RNase toxin 16 of polymorphic toxin system
MFPALLSAEEPLRPPGDCAEAEHKVLKAEVGRACKTTSMKCYDHQECSELLSNWLTYQRCINARRAIMDKCFRGGDESHRREVDNYERGASECSQLMLVKRCPEQCR